MFTKKFPVESYSEEQVKEFESRYERYCFFEIKRLPDTVIRTPDGYEDLEYSEVLGLKRCTEIYTNVLEHLADKLREENKKEKD